MFRKTLLTGLVLAGISSTALAGVITTTTAPAATSYLPVTVPTDTSGLILGVEGFYWTPTNSKLSYGIKDNTYSSSGEYLPNGKIILVDPDYDLGFSVNLGYAFRGHGNDVVLKYTHFSSGDSDSEVCEGSENDVIWTSLLHPGATGFALASEAKAKVEFYYDSVEFLLGQMINIGDKVGLHLATGLHYVRLNTKFITFYYNKLPNIPYSPDTADIEFDSRYYGIGPRVTINGKYKISDGFSFVTEIGGSVLFGNSKMQNYIFLYDDDDQLETTSDIKQNRTFQSVPEVDAKLGLSYTGGNDYKVSVEAGWKVVDYFDVKNVIPFMDKLVRGVYTHHTSKVAFGGPYLSLSVLAG